jgi:copper resistance protein B
MNCLTRLAAVVALGLSGPAFAQDMPGMAMDHGTMDHATMDHATMDHAAPPSTATSGTDLPAGNAPAPKPPMDRYATRVFPASDIERSHRQMMNENGAQTFALVMFNLAEYQPHRGRDGFRWDGEAWYGGDINRLTVKTEGAGAFGNGVDDAEVQALYSRAIDPYFNAQIGVRQDLGRGPKRTYATLGFEGLAPYWFEVEGAVFLSDKGDLLGRLQGYYDQRITQRVVLQPRVELNLAAQDIPASRVGAGLSSAELGLRLRYEIRRQFAPYVGLSWERKVGQTGRYARADGERPTSKGFVAGIRFWF